MVIYFTGTGNSRYLAGLAASRLGDRAVDAAKYISSGEHPVFESEKPYVFLSPVYAWRLPRVFVDWIRKCRFEGNKKSYFIINCGSEIGAASNYAEKFARHMGFDYMGTAEVIMPENYIVMFPAPPKDKEDGIIEKGAERILALCDRISSRAPLDSVKINLMGHIYSDIVNPLFYTFYIGAKKFRATDKCISCGRCSRECMLGNISIKNGRPVWGKSCTHCMACICKCPVEAIEYGKNTVGRRRYICPRE